MLTPFQRRKITHFFTVFDGDGYIDWDYLQRWVQEIAAVRGAAPATPEYDDLASLCAFTWAALERCPRPAEIW